MVIGGCVGEVLSEVTVVELVERVLNLSKGGSRCNSELKVKVLGRSLETNRMRAALGGLRPVVGKEEQQWPIANQKARISVRVHPTREIRWHGTMPQLLTPSPYTGSPGQPFIRDCLFVVLL